MAFQLWLFRCESDSLTWHVHKWRRCYLTMLVALPPVLLSTALEARAQGDSSGVTT
jgi:hypothetical protein